MWIAAVLGSSRSILISRPVSRSAFWSSSWSWDSWSCFWTWSQTFCSLHFFLFCFFAQDNSHDQHNVILILLLILISDLLFSAFFLLLLQTSLKISIIWFSSCSWSRASWSCFLYWSQTFCYLHFFLLQTSLKIRFSSCSWSRASWSCFLYWSQTFCSLHFFFAPDQSQEHHYNCTTKGKT